MSGPSPVAPALHQAEWLQAGDIRLRVVRAGRGDTTLLLLHGYGESLMGYRAVFDALARRYRVIAVDLPGFGLSDKPDAPYDLASYRRRLGDFLERWTRGPVVVVGHSMGGEVAAALALDHPDRVIAAVLIAPAGFALQPFLAGAKDVPSDARGWVASVLSAAMPPQDPDWLEEPSRVGAYTPATDPAYRNAATRVLAEFDFVALRDSFGDIHQPVLLIWGRQDPTIPFVVGREHCGPAALPRISSARQCPASSPSDPSRHRHRGHRDIPAPPDLRRPLRRRTAALENSRERTRTILLLGASHASCRPAWPRSRPRPRPTGWPRRWTPAPTGRTSSSSPATCSRAGAPPPVAAPSHRSTSPPSSSGSACCRWETAAPTYQQVPIVALTPDPTLRTTAQAEHPYAYRDDYVLWSMRNDTLVSLSAEAVFVGLWHRGAGVPVGRLRRDRRARQDRHLPGQ